MTFIAVLSTQKMPASLLEVRFNKNVVHIPSTVFCLVAVLSSTHLCFGPTQRHSRSVSVGLQPSHGIALDNNSNVALPESSACLQ